MTKPMQDMTPAELAALGWSHGMFKDGKAVLAANHLSDEGVAAFRAEAKRIGAEYVALWEMLEFVLK